MELENGNNAEKVQKEIIASLLAQNFARHHLHTHKLKQALGKNSAHLKFMNVDGEVAL